MRKLSVLLTLLLVALCANVSYAYNFWTGEDIPSIAVYNETDGYKGDLEGGVTTSAEGGKLWYWDFKPATSTFMWKWHIGSDWFGRGIEYKVDEAWVQMSASNGNANTITGLDTNKTYRIYIKAKSQSENSTPMGRIVEVTGLDFYNGNGIEYINIFGESGEGPLPMTVTTQDDGSKVWSCEFSPKSTTFEWKWTVKIAGEENASWYGRGVEYFADGKWVQMATVDNGAEKGKNYVNGLDPNKTYRISIKALSSENPGQPIGCIEDLSETSSAIPDGLTREEGIFTVFFDVTGSDKGAPYIWIWNASGSDSGSSAGDGYFDASKDYPGLQMTLVSGNIYKWEYRGNMDYPDKVIFAWGSGKDEKYFDGVDVKNGDFFTLSGVQGTVPVAAKMPEGWYVMGDAFGSVASAANKMSAYEGANDIYYIDIISATAGQKVWFKSFEHDCVITPESSRELKLGMKWLGATDEKNVGYFAFAEDCAEGRLFVNTMSNQVILADKSFNPLTGNGTEIVFFLGDKDGAVKEVNFYLGKDDNYTLFEGARWTKAPYKGFWFIEIPDVSQYDDIKFSVRIDGDNDGNFYDVIPSRVDAYDRANWWKYIYGQIEPIDGVGATSFQTYITPEEYLYEAAKTKTTVYVFGNGFTSNSQTPNWFPENKANAIIMNLYNGVGVLEMDGVTNSGDNRTKLKLSWMPYFDYIDATDGEPERKRAWASFNLGIVGGYDAVSTGGENSSSMFYLRKPRFYNNYSESDWVLADGDENNVTGTCYLVLDSKEGTLTLLTFNPKVGLSENYSIKVEQKAVGGLNESLFADGKMFKGSEAGGNAYPELANDLEVTFTVTPAYMNSQIDGLADKIKALYNVKYLFYNCSHGFKAGESTSDKNSHDGDELIAEFDGPLSGATEFAIKNIVTSNVPQLMIQAVYTLKADVSGNDAKTFHTIPSGLISEKDLSFQTANPDLYGDDFKLEFATLYPQEDGKWGVHFQFPFAASTDKSEMVYYPDYEVSCGMNNQNAAPTHSGMKHLVENPYAWGMIGYEPYESGEYDHAVHNWSNIAKESSSMNLSLDGIASDLDGAAQAVKDGIDVTLHFVYPYVIYKDQIITKVEKSETPARVARAAAAEPEGNYEIRYAYATDNRLYKEEDLKGVITGIENVTVGADAPVDVYSVSGALIMRGTTKAEAVKVLAPGIYVIGKEKVVIK